MFYEKECFTEDELIRFRAFYEKSPQLVKTHKKAFDALNDKYFEYANYEKNFEGNKHLDFVLNNQKYRYDSSFSYLEQKDNLIILKIYYLDNLTRLLVYDIENEEQYAYMAKEFKTTGVVMMMNASTKTGMGYNTGWDYFYNHYQRLVDEESLSIIKSLDRFKYLPINDFEKINYFLLLNASDEMIYNYEILLKFGATRAATELMLRRGLLDKKLFKTYKEELLKNRTYNYILKKEDDVRAAEVKIKEHIDDEYLEKKLATMHKYNRLFWEYKDYIFRVPINLEEVKEESEELSHCLYRTRNRYLKESIIVFLRKKEQPDSPFFTIEIKDEKIVQCRTDNNKTDPDITSVAEEWFSNYKNELIQLQ